MTGRLGPVVASAIHDGHEVRDEVSRLLALDASTRRREEDPYTSCFTRVGDWRVVVHRSRFEVDLNRPRPRAVYRRPEDAWGLEVWRHCLPPGVVSESLEIYDAFYEQIGGVLALLAARHGRIVVLDIHSYNHRRDDPDRAADPDGNPDVNVGTSNMNRRRWAGVVGGFIADVARGTVLGRRLSVAENVRFQGGHMVQWIHDRFPDSVCALAVEVKKVFMDEWTGRCHPEAIADIGRALAGAIPGLRRELECP
jgi:N-formylglutamate amidohydrolase